MGVLNGVTIFEYLETTVATKLRKVVLLKRQNTMIPKLVCEIVGNVRGF